MDISFKPDPTLKGSYYRRIEDIRRALEKLQIHSLSREMQFLTYYFGCEKLARGIIGIYKNQPAIEAFDRNQKFTLKKIVEAADSLKLTFPKKDFEHLFATQPDISGNLAKEITTSARILRNNLNHDFGPTNVMKITEYGRLYLPKMELFIDLGNETLSYLKENYKS